MNEAHPVVEGVDWRSWARSGNEVGESPVWDGTTRSLFWIDIVGQAMHRSSEPEGPIQTWSLPSMVGTYGLHDQGAVVVLADGVYDLDFNGALRRCVGAPYDQAHYRFNDGRCDPAGRLWVGTNRQPRSGVPHGSGSFWRLDDRGLLEQFDGVTIANGLAFSPDGSRMYVADAINHQLQVRDYDVESGTVSEARVFAQLEADLMPDGAAVDVEGGYWVAMYGAGEIHRYTPHGVLDRVLRAPVSHPTMVAFGGDDLTTMFVTSGRAFVRPEILAVEPGAGDVFHAPVGVGGIAEPRFAYRKAVLGHLS